MDCKHSGTVYNTFGQTGESLQVHCDLCSGPEEPVWISHSQLLFLGYNI
ncbi:dynein light chain Tctex-type 3, isoform CRA_c [Mus musculus]|nr:dynein light chain Tctex-type 3, isoform CRA_c [Mus musculus]